MKVLLLTKHLNTGGITSYLLLLVKGLIAKGYDVFVVGSDGNRKDEFVKLGARVELIDLMTKSDFSPKIYFNLKRLQSLIKQNQIDIIHSQMRVTQVLGCLLSRRTSIPCVSTCHGFFKVRLSRRIAPCWGNAVIAISEAVKEHLITDFKVNASKVFLVQNGIDLTQFSQFSREQVLANRKKHHLTAEPVIGIIARLSDVKGHDLLIEAMSLVIKKFPTAKLLIVGEGPDRERLKNQVNQLELNRCVEFFPIVDQTPQMLSLLDVFVNPSYQEGLGLSVMEAQACGIPVVATKVGGVVSLIEHEQTGLLVSQQADRQRVIEDLSVNICRLLEDKNLAKTIFENAYKQAHQNYSSDLMVEKTLKIYQGLMQRS